MKPNRRLPLFWWLLLLPASLVEAQDMDSLRNQLRNSQSVEERIERLLDITAAFASLDHDSALHYATVAERLSQRTTNTYLRDKARLRKSRILMNRGQYEEARTLMMENLNKASIDSTILGLTYRNLGDALTLQQNFEEAITEYLRALSVFEATRDIDNVGDILRKIGSVHGSLNNLRQAVFYLRRALKYAATNKQLRIRVRSGLANVYFARHQTERAITTAHQAEALAVELGDTEYLRTIYSNLCVFYLKQGDYPLATKYGQQGLALSEESHHNTNALLNNLGYAWLQRGDYPRAIAHFSRISSEVEGDLKADVLHSFMEAYRRQGNLDQALSYAIRYANLRDSIHAQAQQERVAELTEQYESEKKQQQIDLLSAQSELNRSKLRQQRMFTGGFGALLLLSGVVGLLWFRGQKTKQALLTASIQHRLLRTQLNPHFLFHALHSIQGFIGRNQQQESASYLSSFSKLMRSILESSDQDFITVAEDAQALSDYLHLQQLNTSDATYRYRVVVDDTLDDEVTVLPPMFTQPFVENALLHGIAGRSCGEVSVHYTHDAHSLRVTIRDNGTGDQKSTRNTNLLHRSMSTEILNERVANLKKVHQYPCTIAVHHPEPGTQVILTFPLRYKRL